MHLVDSGYNTENRRILIRQRRGNYCAKLKKGKLKTERLLKITILDEQEPSVQSADRTKAVKVWSWGSLYSLRPENWPYRSAIISENSGFHAGENPSEATVPESNQIRGLHETINF